MSAIVVVIDIYVISRLVGEKKQQGTQFARNDPGLIGNRYVARNASGD